jgi:O-antigen ligase
VLLFLVAATPWAFGSTHPFAVRIVTAVALGTCALGVAAGLRGEGGLALRPILPVAGLLVLGMVQLLPLPEGLHRVLAPASAAVWHPTEEAAAAVLGSGFRPISVEPGATRRWLSFVLGLTGLALVAAPALRDRRHALWAALVVGAAGVAVGLFGVVARTLFGARLYGTIAVPTIAPFGPFVSKNHFAGYVEMAALLALGLAAGLADEARRGRGALGWIQSSRAGRVVLAGGAAGIMALAVLISLSRGGVVSLGAGALALLVYRNLGRGSVRHGWRVALALLAAVAVSAAAFAVLPTEGRDRLASLAGVTGEASGAFRLGVWRDTLRLAAASPVVGHGFGAFADALPPFKRGAGDLRVEHAENDYLETLADGGALGLGLALAVAWLLAQRIARGFGNEPDRLKRGLALGAAAGLTALLVHSLFDFNLRITSNALLAALLAAWGFSAETDPPERSRVRVIGFLLALLLGLGATILSASASTPVAHLAPVRDALARATPLRLEAAEDALVGHLQQRPGDAEAWLNLAWVRAARGFRAEGAALARYATALDPERRSIKAKAEALTRFAAQ